MSDYYKLRDIDIRTRWFPKHEASFIDVQGNHFLTWRKPGTSNYFCRYVIDGQFLMVYGDIGEAVYGWSEQIDWKFLAGLNLDYFAGKCCASEFGRGYKEWDSDVAEASVRDRLNQLKGEEFSTWRDAEIDALEEIPLGSFNKDDLRRAAEEVYNTIGDAEQASSIADLGTVIAHRCQGHLVGIQMAYLQSLIRQKKS